MITIEKIKFKAGLWSRRISQVFDSLLVDSSTREFIRFNLEKWRKKRADEKNARAVILVGLYDWNTMIYGYSHLTNYLAEKYQAKVRAFTFKRIPSLKLAKIYGSFGAKLDLTILHALPFQGKAKKTTAKIFGSLENKWDVLKIEIDGVVIGDQIYDEYLRIYSKYTIDTNCPNLRAVIFRAVKIFYACQNYMDKNRVVAVIPDHVVYLNCGILTRVAAARKIPIFLYRDYPLSYLIQPDTNPPESIPGKVMEFPCYKYPELFGKFSPEERAAILEKSTKALEDKLSGKPSILFDGKFSAYATQGQPVFPGKKTRPRILVMLHDFSDSPHFYRHALFPDFFDWNCFLFEHASKTDFEWYVKPHPGIKIFEDPNLREANRSAIEALQRRYPSMKFLDPLTSNQKIIEESVDALFTVYGTAGHEFAYRGIPVVNAGDNPHIAYDFNFHPKTVEEYKSLIYRADSLSITMDKKKIAECFYMQFNYNREFGKAFTFVKFKNTDEFLEKSQHSRGWRFFLEQSSPSQDAMMKSYLDGFFARTQ